MPKKIKFRDKEIFYNYHWIDENTFIFDFGDGEFVDSEEHDYFIHFEYHLDNDKWIVEIWWEDDNLNIDEFDESDADEYIMEHEIEEVIEFAEQLLDYCD